MKNEKEKQLSVLYDLLIQELTARVVSGEASSGDLSVIVKFLKDNGIDAHLHDEAPIMNLAKVLPFVEDEDKPKDKPKEKAQ